MRPPSICTCGACGLSWDDSISTALTPTPSARCPFEYFHKKRRKLTPKDIPKDYPVKVIGLTITHH